MKSIEISGNARTNISKASNRELRAQDNVPCVLYGGSENVHFQSHSLAFRDLIYTPEVKTVSLDVDGAKYNAVMQEVQFHPITDKILHIDFLELQDDKPVKIAVPVKLKGTSEGVKQGGKLTLKMRKIKIKALPQDLPDAIEVNIEPLDIGDTFRISELNIPGVEILESPNNMVVSVRVTRAVIVEEETPAVAAEGAEAPADGAEKKEEPAGAPA
jgi:large subunit ribosomal protein L25